MPFTNILSGDNGSFSQILFATVNKYNHHSIRINLNSSFFIFLLYSIYSVISSCKWHDVQIAAMALFQFHLNCKYGGLLICLDINWHRRAYSNKNYSKERRNSWERHRLNQDRAYDDNNQLLLLCSIIHISLNSLMFPTYYEISGVVLFGLIGDLMTTWLGNAPMILIGLRGRDDLSIIDYIKDPWYLALYIVVYFLQPLIYTSDSSRYRVCRRLKYQ